MVWLRNFCKNGLQHCLDNAKDIVRQCNEHLLDIFVGFKSLRRRCRKTAFDEATNELFDDPPKQFNAEVFNVMMDKSKLVVFLIYQYSKENNAVLWTN